jgi:hypothetical protein
MSYKLSFTLYFQDSMNVDEKKARWTKHVDKVKDIPEVQEYLQDYVIEPLPAEPTAPKQWDAIGHLKFADKETADRVLSGPAWQAVVDDANDGLVDWTLVLGGVMESKKAI